RLGATKAIPINVRLICATNANIRQMVDEGTFRQDLLYRINTIEIHIPPLRERGEDIILLAEHFLQKYAHKYKKDIQGLTREAKQKLMKYAWPGNVRELQHAIERAVILSQNLWLRPNDFMLTPQVEKKNMLDETLNLEELEQKAIKRAMKRCAGNVSSAAELLGITRYALYRKIEKLGL
ncbi:MAG: sigma-54-dependent Fis family transcriptional regulator, partial [Bacteroides sp.]|nr:sigma-54-dependent Fis family transcriptional regulator [Bacteroides sp.]